MAGTAALWLLATARDMIQAQSIAYFVDVVRYGSLRRAAEISLVSPSAISRQIANLEEELGLPLFDRSSRGMVPTEAGRLLMEFAEESELRIRRLRSEVDDLHTLKRGVVRMAVVEAVTSEFLPRLLADFAKLYPQIKFEIDICGSHEVANRVGANVVEIGIGFNVLSRDDLTLQSRIQQPLKLICRVGHPLASRSSVSMTDLLESEVALPNRTFGIHYLVGRAATKSKVKLRVAYVSDSLELIKMIVSSTDVVSFMPPLTFAREEKLKLLQSVSVSDIDSERSSLDIVTASDRKLPVAARTFLTKLLAHARLR